jgi:hypothetical protein
LESFEAQQEQDVSAALAAQGLICRASCLLQASTGWLQQQHGLH